ncbi:MarR family winged helix-turn-helix transcriptional regulator [Frigoribacterium sp. R86507]|uniref:MarR family winged helix-turn-helix transcriptional regulator n=1 Tax=Frigoribacterium sp. R86507 TaxID=3093850 RepID=UPI0037CCB5FB
MTTPRRNLLEALRHYALSYQESTRELARRMDLPTVDGTALGEILWAEYDGAPLSPGRLSMRVGLTSGATNALINRLEALGLVSRSRESDDRRVVTLRTTETARERAAVFLDPSTAALEAALDEYDDVTLDTVRSVLVQLAAVLPGTDQDGARRPR